MVIPGAGYQEPTPSVNLRTAWIAYRDPVLTLLKKLNMPGVVVLAFNPCIQPEGSTETQFQKTKNHRGIVI